MDLVIEICVTDANDRIEADLRSELHALLSGKGLRVADVATFEPSVGSQAVLAGMANGTAKVRVCKVE